MRPLLTTLADTLHVRPWPDDVLDQLGFDPRTAYVEQYWLGILGPSTTWLMRRLVAGFDYDPDGFDLPLAETARWLGLGDRGGRQSPFLRALNRTIQFDLSQMCGTDELAVRRRLPPLNQRQLARLSPAQQAAHGRWQDQQLAEPAGAAQRRRGRQLALSLLELGEDLDSTERQLLHWQYHPALAHEAVTWAWEQHRQAEQTAAS
jgi:hypothetical protein